MDNRKIRAFLTCVDLGSLTKAAEELRYTQSGLTHMMNAFEKELGIKLLRRGHGGVELTPTGEHLLPWLRAIDSRYAALERELRRLSGASAQLLRVGAFSSMAQHWLPAMVQNFKRELPEAEVLVQMCTIYEVYELVAKGEVDCALVGRQDSMLGDLEWIPLRNDELVAVLPGDYRNKGMLFDVRGFEGQNFLMPSNGFELDILPVFEASGVNPRISYTNMDDPAIISMVEHKLGISILSDLVMWGRRENVVSLPLKPPSYRELGLLLPREKQEEPLAKRFVACAQATVRQLYTTAGGEGSI